MHGKSSQIDMVNGPLAGKILLFAIPLMCTTVLQLVFNATNTILVGQFSGSTALAAVGSTTPLINLMTQLFIGISVGANVVAAQAIGKGKLYEVPRIVGTAIMTSIFSGVILLAVGQIMAHHFLVWMGTPENVIALSERYIRVYFCGMPFLMMFNFGAALLRAKGDTKRPMIYLLIAGVVNVGLGSLLIIVFDLGVVGVGAATVTAQCISALLVIRSLVREEDFMHLERRYMQIDRGIFKKILMIGLPAGIQSAVFCFSNVVIQSSVNSFGSVMMAGSAAAVSIGDFVYQPINAFYQTALSFNGQNMGAGKYDRIDRISLLCLIYVAAVGCILSFSAYLLGPYLLQLYTNDAEVIAAGMIRMYCCVRLYEICGIMDVMPGIMRGMGYSTLPMIVSLLGCCLFRVVWVATYFQAHHTIENLYLSFPISWIMTFAAHIICFFIVRKRIRTGRHMRIQNL